MYPRLQPYVSCLHGALLREDLGEDVRVAGGALHEALHLHGHVDLVRA